jgi:hypothetical protein
VSRHHAAKQTAVGPAATADTLADMVADLTTMVVHREHYEIQTLNRDGSSTWVGRDHFSSHASLVDQLAHAVEQSASTEAGEGPRPGFGSKPTARLEALDAYTRIDVGAAAWCRDLGARRVPHGTKDRVRTVRDLVSGADERTRRSVAADVRAWWTQARVLTGWDSPAWKPTAACPACDAGGTLRIRLAAQAAVCVDCGVTWDPDTIGLLADHIRAEADAAGDRRGASPVPVGGRPRDGGPVRCHCLVCDPGYRYWRLCPVCGHVGLPSAPVCQKPLDHRFGCTGPVV